MFGFFSSSRASVFEERRKKQEVWKTMRRVIDYHASRDLVRGQDRRDYSRRAVSVPVLVQIVGYPVEYAPIIGVTKNFSDDGVALLSTSEFPVSESAFCCVQGSQPICFLGLTRRSHYVGGGYWETGISFQEMTHLSEWGSLRELAKSLDPEHYS